MIQFKQHHFAGFVTDLGGVTSHTAIVARSLEHPGGRRRCTTRAQLIREDELLIVDGTQPACVIVNPDRAGARRVPAAAEPARARARRS